ncbi:polysaccharide deacetylase family protein [Bacteroidota bacterium]
MFKARLKAEISKVNFLLGRNPFTETISNYRNYIPKPYQSVLLLSADFELAWAWRYTKSSKNPYGKTILKARKERENIPQLIKLCEQYNIPITWLTVGHLFLESCEKVNGIVHPDIIRPNHFENNYWKFTGKDWLEYDPCSNVNDATEWYAPDLIKMIKESPVNHEIGCHTFSHIDCRDEVCSPEQLKIELQECKKLAKERGLKLKSFVHPGHTIGNLDILANEGFTNFRTDYRNVLGYPVKHDNGIWELQQTAEIAYRKEWTVDYHIKRYNMIIDRAIKSSSVCVLWFHPSFEDVFIDKILPNLFAHINKKQKHIWVTTQSIYFDWQNKNSIL